MLAERHHRDGHGDERKAKLGRAGVEVGQLEFAKHARGEIGVDREQEVAAERDQRDVEADIGAEADPGEDQQGGQPVAAMVDEIAEARAFDLAEAGKAAVHRIAEPLDTVTDDGEHQPGGGEVAQHIAEEGDDRADHAERGELVGRHPCGCVGAQVIEQAAFGAREQIVLDASERLAFDGFGTFKHGCL